MKLAKICFDSFKSLFQAELEIKEPCVGLVGTNESGKSNVLYAIRTLSGERKLTAADAHRRAKKLNPCLRFIFELDESERDALKSGIHAWLAENTKGDVVSLPEDLSICHRIEFSLPTGPEARSFSIPGLGLAPNGRVLNPQMAQDSAIVLNYKGEQVSLPHALVVPEEVIKSNMLTVSDGAIKDDIVRAESKEPKVRLKKVEDSKGSATGDEAGAGIADSIARTLDRLNELSAQKELITLEREKIDSELRAASPPSDPAATAVLESNKARYKDLADQLVQVESETKIRTDQLLALREPLDSKYSSNREYLDFHLQNVLSKMFNEKLPHVVFWKYDAKYLLPKEILLSDILNADSLEKIPRPLLNVFRLGLQLDSLDDLKRLIAAIQSEGVERNATQHMLQKGVNDYLKGVWKDYDQDVEVSLEQERIRFTIYDPKVADRSYFYLEERSEGAQTFISFLLTIGTEATHNVINNTILLLDEPETHLHPKGVRFMLQELIEISKHDNLVVFATHSVFMIDRDKYDRHFKLEKTAERTVLTPSSQDRIGFFMQEEVLYGALDLDPNVDFESAKRYNFVFEGIADALLFRAFYESNVKSPYPAKQSTFNHGGGCSRIRDYFRKKPIQLGSIWVFVLDNDQPAESLKAFLEGRYKRFIGKDIHTFGYSSDRRKIEVLEDLLPIEFMLPILIAVAGELKLGIPDALTKASGQEPRPSFEEMLGLLVREGSPQKEALKESFKEGINRAIQAALAEKKGALEKTFPEYSKWFQSTIGSLVAAKERLRAESKERAELGSTEEKSSQTETVSSSGDAPEPEQESLT
jgi:hypothetical protein